MCCIHVCIMSQRDIRPSNTLINVFIIWADLDFQCPHKNNRHIRVLLPNGA